MEKKQDPKITNRKHSDWYFAEAQGYLVLQIPVETTALENYEGTRTDEKNLDPKPEEYKKQQGKYSVGKSFR